MGMAEGVDEEGGRGRGLGCAYTSFGSLAICQLWLVCWHSGAPIFKLAMWRTPKL